MLYKPPKAGISPWKKLLRKLLFWSAVIVCLWLLASTWPHNPVALLLQAFFNENSINPLVQIFCPLTHLVCK